MQSRIGPAVMMLGCRFSAVVPRPHPVTEDAHPPPWSVVAAPDIALERGALLTSIAVTAVLGALGVVWGITTGSQMILLDGVYAVVGIAVSWLLLRATALARRSPGSKYHFGRAAATPLVIGIQGLVLLATLAYAAFEAALVIRAGGSTPAAGWAIIYGVVAAAASLLTWEWLRRRAGSSDVLTAEATAWWIGAMRATGMVVGFTLLAVLTGSRWDGAAPYVDPVMVLITCAAFVAPPVTMVRTAVAELLESVPAENLQAEVHAAVAAVAADFEIADPDVRMTKIGPKLYVEAVAAVDPSVTVAQQQAVFDELDRRLDRLPYDIWLTVELTPHSPTADPTTPEDAHG